MTWFIFCTPDARSVFKRIVIDTRTHSLIDQIKRILENKIPKDMPYTMKYSVAGVEILIISKINYLVNSRLVSYDHINNNACHYRSFE